MKYEMTESSMINNPHKENDVWNTSMYSNAQNSLNIQMNYQNEYDDEEDIEKQKFSKQNNSHIIDNINNDKNSENSTKSNVTEIR